ncbi:hypothetical protein TNCV_569411 [Trichonephila clavipes]|nr:hypothetical protein TNCV_569411 [Trichonephila clavipes]
MSPSQPNAMDVVSPKLPAYRTLRLKIWISAKEKCDDIKVIFRIGSHVLCPRHEESIASPFWRYNVPIRTTWSLVRQSR